MRAVTTLAAVVLSGILTTAALAAPLTASPTNAGGAPLAEASIPATPSDQPVRIGLGWGLTKAEVSASNGLWLIVGDRIQGEVEAAKPVALTVALGGLQVEGLALSTPGPVRLVPKPPGYITYDGKAYRGEIEALLTPLGRLSVVNLLNLEDYLLAVVPHEMPAAWPAEALKAQAVASRSYTITNLGKRKADGFDLRNTTDDQVYGGIQAEKPAASEAVRQTKGQVVTLGGKPVATYYHSSSGGHTENNEDIWTGGSPVPYLRGVEDYDSLPGNRWTSWRFEFSLEEFAQRLAKAGFPVGEVRSVTPGPHGASGRPTRWTVEGSAGKASLSMLQMRTSLGLPAPVRSITLRAEGSPTQPSPPPPPPPKPNPVNVVGADGRVSSRSLAGSYVVSPGGVSQLPAGLAVASGAEVTTVVGSIEAGPVTPPAPTPPPLVAKPTAVEVEGSGSGHGVGLSQWGAHGMALQGKSYTEILTHFYTGTKVETR